MKITMAQINTTPNDFEGNFDKIRNGIAAGIRDSSDVVVFPELTIPGYLVKDLVYTSGFVEKNLEYLQRLAKLTDELSLTVIVGYIDRNYKGVGKPFRNMAAVIRGGIVIATYQKHLLPFYDVFDEGRYFEPGTEVCVFDINGNKCAIALCEDCWNDKGQDDYCYIDNPIQKYREFGINYLFSLNSSPYAKGKPKHRIEMLQQISWQWKKDADLNIIYVNQIGGQDELTFDGHSMIIAKGEVLTYLQTDVKPSANLDMYETVVVHKSGNRCPLINFKFELDHLKMTLLGLHDYIIKSGFKKVVLGSSGGVDSALVATLASLAIGARNVTCIMMPSIYSSEGSVKDAKELHKRLGCNEILVPIDNIPFQNYLNEKFGFMKHVGTITEPPKLDRNEVYTQIKEYNKVANENLQARMRGQINMHFSNATGALTLTTGNKTELATGYSTLYGDMCGGFNPIGDMYKLEVFAMCKQINDLYKNLIPTEITSKAPSAELAPGQTDEASLLPYPILDEIARLYIEDYVTDYKAYKVKTQGKGDQVANEKDFNRITRLIYVNEFKRRQAAPMIKLSKVAFGTGRRLPIVKK